MIKHKVVWSDDWGRHVRFEIGPVNITIKEIDKYPILFWLFAIKGLVRIKYLTKFAKKVILNSNLSVDEKKNLLSRGV